MARPLRLEFAGALYHITSRGDRREAIYLDDGDREDFLDLLGAVCRRFNWTVHSYCLMTNHYHLLVETPDANLSQGMRQLNGVYTQSFNRRHSRVGHVFQGRFKGILVQKSAYLLELSRYVVLNPVRAGMVEDAGDWPWSSYGAVIGNTDAPPWLDTDWLLGQFGTLRRTAVKEYVDFVRAGVGQASPWEQLRYQVFLGDESFVERFHDTKRPDQVREVPKGQRRALAKSLDEYRSSCSNRDEAMASAYGSGAYSMKEIGDFFGVHYMTVSRAVRRFEAQALDSAATPP